MSEIEIDLSRIQFEDSNMPLFKEKKLILKNKNFIFAKNGSGKSTLTNAIKEEKSDEFDIHVFTGFESVLGENKKLDAFALSVKASDNEKEIEYLEDRKATLELEYSKIKKSLMPPEVLEDKNIYTEFSDVKESLSEKESKMNSFYTASARDIGLFKNPQIVLNTRLYNRTKFKEEINEAKELEDLEIEKMKNILDAKTRNITEVDNKVMGFEKYVESINQIMESQVEEKIKIVRLNSEEKIKFAKEGLKIHTSDEDDICTFCGNKLTQSTMDELESYFSVNEVKELQKRITVEKKNLKQELIQLEDLNISTEEFYPDFITDVVKEINILDTNLEQIKQFFTDLIIKLEEKESKLFSKCENVEINIPNNLDFTDLNKLIKKNNYFSENLLKEQEAARKKLRCHEIAKILQLNNYREHISEIERTKVLFDVKKEEFDKENAKKFVLESQIQSIEEDIKLLKPIAEREAVERINEKLKHKVSWELDFLEDENSGYYQIKEGSSYRGVTKLSTGEKNVIAFLYFIEKLEVNDDIRKRNKMILFDDPMSSNDDTMQYLIICELQNLFQAKDKNKFNADKDIMLILTHNIHFYLNVQPHGNFKDKNGKTKYDKNNFYRIYNGSFIPIRSEKEDFKTSYASLWMELKDLYDCNHTNSMLNSMRRIIETYVGFNSINPNDFYKDNQDSRKLFNVNSHSIDDLSVDPSIEGRDELKDLFKQIFIDNNAEEHFLKYWPK